MDDAKRFQTDAIHEENPPIQDRTVIAAFADARTADEARQALEDAGYKAVEVTTAEAADQGKPVHEHGFWNRLKAMFGGHRDAPAYAEAVRSGRSLVTLHTEQGRAAYAVDILDGFSPVELKGGEQAWIDDTPSREAAASDVLATPDTGIAGEGDSVIEEDLLIVEVDPDLGNDRVRGYSRTLPVAVADRDRAVSDTGIDDSPVADPVKRAD